MKKINFLVVLLLIGNVLIAQKTVSGYVLDKTNKTPISYVNIVAYGVDSVLIDGTITNAEGKFSLSNIKKDSIILNFSYLGYETQNLKISLSQNTISIGEVLLEETMSELGEVLVVGKKPLIEQQADKLVVNVSQSPSAQGNNALEMLKKIPGVFVDAEGNVKLNNQKVEIWIDGRPTYLSGVQLENLLKTTAGNDIEKIELISNPSAKYDASGEGGIINIKSKSVLAKGLNGSVTGKYEGMYYDMDYEKIDQEKTDGRYLQNENVSLNLNLRTEKTYSSLNVSETMDWGCMNFSSTVTQDDFMQKSKSLSRDESKMYFAKLTNDWYINKQNTLGFVYTMPVSKNILKSIPEFNTSYQSNKGGVDNYTYTDSKNDDNTNQYQANLNYTHLFCDSLSRELNAEINYMRYDHTSASVQNNDVFFVEMPSENYKYGNDMDSKQLIDLYSAKIDFQTNFWKMSQLEVGGKYTLSNMNYNLDQLFSKKADESRRITKYGFKESVFALYVSVMKQFSQKWNAKLGVRSEYTHSRGEWLSVDTVTIKKYIDFFPSAFVGFNPSEKWRFSATYSMRIYRPDYESLNPARYYIDAHTICQGNPNLNPQYVHSTQLQAGFGDYLQFSLATHQSKDIQSQSVTFDKTTSEQVLLNENFGRRNQFNADITLAEVPIVKKVMTFTLYSLYIYTKQKDKSFENSSNGNYNYLALNFYLPKNCRIELSGYYQTSFIFAHFKADEMYGMDFSLKKSFLEERLQLAFQMTDILRSAENMTFKILPDTETRQIISQNRYGQRVRLSLVYNFGSKYQVRQRNVGNVEETSRLGKSSQF